MITSDPADAQQVLDALTALGLYAPLPSDLRALCEDLIQTVTAPAFPGALVPVVDAAGNMHVDIATATVGDWRRLKPILLAFAGPTITTFAGVPAPFSSSDGAGQILMGTTPAVTAVMSLAADDASRMRALRALSRARATLGRAPDLQRSAPVPTSWLLARFQDHLNVRRRDAAAHILERLKTELRLDALNLKFLEVQLYATFGDWRAILETPEFPSLCQARRTSAITALLLEALYQVHLATAFDAADFDCLRARYSADVRPFAHSMLTVPPPPSLTPGGARIYALEALNGATGADLSAVIHADTAKLGWLADHLVPAPEPESEPSAETSIDIAREKLLEADAADDTDRVSAVLQAMAKLSPEELDHLRGAIPFAPIVASIEPLDENDLPTSWLAWLTRAADPAFVTALDVARRGASEWPIETTSGDPVAVQALVAAIDRAQQSDLAAERTSLALPYLVAWLQRDEPFPRPALEPVYSSLLTLFALGNARGESIYDSTQILVSAILASGLDQKGYGTLIADVREIAGDGFGVDMIYWLLEIVEAFMHAATTDAAAREAFLHEILARIAPLFARLTSLQRVAVELLSTELGWTLDTLGASRSSAEPDGLAARLAGLRIAIYSLTESSSRQAKAALEALSPTVAVDTNADHGGTARLRALSENSDLFVMAWLSAKHAATDFIREHRGDRPLVYAQGKGFSSILRAVEDHLLRAA